jgi:hypothetical protein
VLTSLGLGWAARTGAAGPCGGRGKLAGWDGFWDEAGFWPMVSLKKENIFKFSNLFSICKPI